MPRQADIHLMSLDASLLVTFIEDFLSIYHIKLVNLLLVRAIVLISRSFVAHAYIVLVQSIILLV